MPWATSSRPRHRRGTRTPGARRDRAPAGPQGAEHHRRLMAVRQPAHHRPRRHRAARRVGRRARDRQHHGGVARPAHVHRPRTNDEYPCRYDEALFTTESPKGDVISEYLADPAPAQTFKVVGFYAPSDEGVYDQWGSSGPGYQAFVASPNSTGHVASAYLATNLSTRADIDALVEEYTGASSAASAEVDPSQSSAQTADWPAAYLHDGLLRYQGPGRRPRHLGHALHAGGHPLRRGHRRLRLAHLQLVRHRRVRAHAPVRPALLPRREQAPAAPQRVRRGPHAGRHRHPSRPGNRTRGHLRGVQHRGRGHRDAHRPGGLRGHGPHRHHGRPAGDRAVRAARPHHRAGERDGPGVAREPRLRHRRHPSIARRAPLARERKASARRLMAMGTAAPPRPRPRPSAHAHRRRARMLAHRNLTRASSKGRVAVASLAVSVALIIISGAISHYLGFLTRVWRTAAAATSRSASTACSRRTSRPPRASRTSTAHTAPWPTSRGPRARATCSRRPSTAALTKACSTSTRSPRTARSTTCPIAA